MEWFRHDVNAHDDLKVKKLLRKSGFSALGVYWFLIELLFSNDGRMACSEAADEVSLIDGLSEEDSMTYIQKLVDLGLLFVDENGLLGSHRVDSEIGFHENNRQRYSNMGKASAEARRNKSATEDEHTLNVGSTQDEHTLNTNKQTNRQTYNNSPLHTNVCIPPLGETNTPKKRFSHPSLEEVRAYCLERNNNVNPEAFIDYYSSQNWKKANGVPLTDWKAGVRTWERKEKEMSAPQFGRKMVEDLEERRRLNASIDPRTGTPRRNV